MMNRLNSMVMEGRPMNRTADNPYALAGWLAITSALLFLPGAALGITTDLIFRRSGSLPLGMAMVYFLVAIAQAGCALYALYRFRDYINEHFDFHETDGLITVILIGAMAITAVGLVGRVAVWSGAGTPASLAFFGFLLLVGIPLSIISIIFAVKLLRLPSDLGGLLKPLIVVNIAACVCFLLVVLAPLGLLINAVGDVLIGVVLLRQLGRDDGPEFV